MFPSSLLRSENLLSGTLLLLETRFGDGVLPAKFEIADKETEDEAEAGDSSVEDPHTAQGEGVGAEDDRLLIRREGLDELSLGASEGFLDGAGIFGAQRGSNARHLLGEDVLVDNRAKDGGDGG